MANQPFGKLPNDKKATIIVRKKSGDVRITCHFNPEKYSISRSVSYNAQELKGQNVSALEFGGGQPNRLSLNLLFDTSLEDTPGDVRTVTRPLWDAAKIDPDKVNSVTGRGEPPHVIFIWGKAWTFEAVITSISQEFILFNQDGIPLRSNVNLELMQVKDDMSFGKQNPTSGGTPGKIYTVREGDRLDLLAQQYYQKPMLWRYIAEHNDIDNPRSLVPGQKLIIPPLP